jgi:hypothetical protein
MPCGAKEVGGVYRPSPKLRPGKSSPARVHTVPQAGLSRRSSSGGAATRDSAPGTTGGKVGSIRRQLAIDPGRMKPDSARAR